MAKVFTINSFSEFLRKHPRVHNKFPNARKITRAAFDRTCCSKKKRRNAANIYKNTIIELTKSKMFCRMVVERAKENVVFNDGSDKTFAKIMSNQKKVFLGGTRNGSLWRDKMERLLSVQGLGFFNPVVENWTEECVAEEIKQREECDYCLYVLTPKMTGVYSVAEVVDDSNKRPEKTVLVVLDADGGNLFDEHQVKSMKQTAKMVIANGGQAFESLAEAAEELNG
jgi:hypothetical protein